MKIDETENRATSVEVYDATIETYITTVFKVRDKNTMSLPPKIVADVMAANHTQPQKSSTTFRDSGG